MHSTFQWLDSWSGVVVRWQATAEREKPMLIAVMCFRCRRSKKWPSVDAVNILNYHLHQNHEIHRIHYAQLNDWKA